MKTFPEIFTPSLFKEQQELVKKERLKSYLRKEIYEHVLNRRGIDDYFEIDRFKQKYFTKGENAVLQECIRDVMEELKKLGWLVGLGFGGMGLFIYVDKKPINYFANSIGIDM